MKPKKFVVVPGYVKDDDGSEKWVSAAKLIGLYGVNPEDCIILRDSDVRPKGYNIKFLHTLI